MRSALTVHFRHHAILFNCSMISYYIISAANTSCHPLPPTQSSIVSGSFSVLSVHALSAHPVSSINSTHWQNLLLNLLVFSQVTLIHKFSSTHKSCCTSLLYNKAFKPLLGIKSIGMYWQYWLHNYLILLHLLEHRNSHLQVIHGKQWLL